VKALVTGASGFLGRHVVAALVARGHEVRAMVRPAARLEEGWPASVEVFRADLRSSRDLEAAFEGVDVLLHLVVTHTGGEDVQFASAVVGTERLLEAMARSRCRRVVLAGTFAVYDRTRVRGAFDESTPVLAGKTLYEYDGYTIAKSWQERVTRRFAQEHGWELTVLRPGNLWGRGNESMSALGVKAGKVYFVIGPLMRLPLSYVENCADVFARAAEDPRAIGQTLNVVDGPGPRIWHYLGEYLRGTGQRALRVPVPYWLVYGLLRLARATLFRRSRKLPSILVPRLFELRIRGFRWENRRLRDVLGWRPLFDWRESLERTYGPRAGADASSPRPTATAG